MDVKPFKSVESTREFRLDINKSIFLTEARMVKSEEDVKNFLDYVKEKHPKATHHCYAYSFNDTVLREKAEDDGEPSGTSGMPILKAIQMNGLSNSMIVVTRYFGGIKLGAGGLTRAYMSSATGVIEDAGIREFKCFYDISIHIKYELIDIILNYFNKQNVRLLDSIYLEDANFIITIPVEDYEDLKSDLMNISSGRIDIEIKKEVLRWVLV